MFSRSEPSAMQKRCKRICGLYATSERRWRRRSRRASAKLWEWSHEEQQLDSTLCVTLPRARRGREWVVRLGVAYETGSAQEVAHVPMTLDDEEQTPRRSRRHERPDTQRLSWCWASGTPMFIAPDPGAAATLDAQ